MKTFSNIGNFVVKLQGLDENKKKMIFFTIMGVSVLLMIFFQLQSSKRKFAELKGVVRSANVSANIDFPETNFFPENNSFSEENTNDPFSGLNGDISGLPGLEDLQKLSELEGMEGFNNLSGLDEMNDIGRNIPKEQAEEKLFPGWKAFDGRNYGFEIGYPEEWFVKTMPEEVYISPESLKDEMAFSAESLAIKIQSVSGPTDLKSIAGYYLNPLNDEKIKIETENVKIGGEN